MNPIDFVLVFAIAFALGWKLGSYFQLLAFKDLVKDLGISTSELKRIIETTEQDGDGEGDEFDLLIEKHGDNLYAYIKDTNEFIGQATTSELLIERIAERFKNVKFRITPEDGAEYLKDAPGFKEAMK